MQYILKGGLGCGKNTIMSKLVVRYVSRSCKTESFYCSSNPESIDGVAIFGAGISIVDATAPHVTEAVFSGFTHKIIDYGISVRLGLEIFRDDFFSLARKKKEGYASLYRLLSASKDVLYYDVLGIKLLDLPIESLCLSET